jgi:hypothetical protein
LVMLVQGACATSRLVPYTEINGGC